MCYFWSVFDHSFVFGFVVDCDLVNMKRQYSTNNQQHKRTRYKDEESYFEDDEDDRRYSSSYNNETKSKNTTEEEIDPLDAFMMNLEVSIT
jgi:hypothetical protein